MEKGDAGEKITVEKSIYGVFRSSWEFFQRALQVQHPLDNPQLVEPSNLRAIRFICNHSASDVALFRAKQLKKFTNRAAELSSAEMELKATLDPHVKNVLADKRLLLFKEMALEAGVGDDGLFNELTEGFSLTGAMSESK